MPKSILFPLQRVRPGSRDTRWKKGVPPFKQLGPLPTRAALTITGTTRDSSGSALANCVVQLFRTSDDRFIEEVTSDGSGVYTFSPVGQGTLYYVVAYKAGSPDVAGTTVNTLVGT